MIIVGFTKTSTSVTLNLSNVLSERLDPKTTCGLSLYGLPEPKQKVGDLPNETSGSLYTKCEWCSRGKMG